MDLATINLNLLLALDALLGEQNVTRAAARVGLTQSTMSHALSQLRELLDDPVLVRAARGMQATPRALALRESLRAALEHARAVFEPTEEFDPATCTRRFTLAMPDVAQFLIAAKLLSETKHRAPRIELNFQPRPGGFDPGRLTSGEVDLMSAPAPQLPPQFHSCEVVTAAPLVCIARKGHPGIGKRLTLKKYLALEHLVVGAGRPHNTELDRKLAQLGEKRTIALTIPSFLSIPWIVCETDLVATLPAAVAGSFASRFALEQRRVPFEIMHSPIHMIWHERTHMDPASAWLREVVAEVAQALPSR